MGLFSFTQEIAMDLGTANTIITTNGKIVVDELRWTLAQPILPFVVMMVLAVPRSIAISCVKENNPIY